MADDLAAVLTLLYGSGTRWTTLRAEDEERADEERGMQAFLRRVPPGAVVSSRGTPGPADRDPRWSVWIRPPAQSRADFGGAETRVDLDAGPLLEAAARAETLWPGAAE